MGKIDKKALLSSAKKLSTDRIVQVKITMPIYLIFKILSLAIVFYYAVIELPISLFHTDKLTNVIISILFSRGIPLEGLQFIVYMVSTLLSMVFYYYILLNVSVTISGHPERVIAFIKHITLSIRNYSEFQNDEIIRSYANNILSEVSSYSSARKPIALFGFLSVFGYALQISSINFFVISLGILIEALTIMIIQSYGITRIRDVSYLVNRAYKDYENISNYFKIHKMPRGRVTIPKGMVYKFYHILILLVISPLIFLEIVFFIFIISHFAKFILAISQYMQEEWMFEERIIDIANDILEKY